MLKLETLSDEALVKLLGKGNVAAFEILYARYWARLYAAAYKRLKSRELCQELIQDLFVSLWIKRKTFVLKSSLEAYLLSAVRYKVFSYIEKEIVRRNYRLSLPEISLWIDNSTEEHILQHDLAQQLEGEMAHLPDKCRQVFELSRKGQKSNREIARQLNISEKTVENHISKALRILRLHLRNNIISFFF